MNDKSKLTGHDTNYYLAAVPYPKRLPPYVAECEDIIEALELTFAEACALKAIWRSAAARLGNGKPGTTALYDAQKVTYYGKRMEAKASRPEDYEQARQLLLQSIAK